MGFLSLHQKKKKLKTLRIFKFFYHDMFVIIK
jgi:hypothetical protein